MNNFLNQLLNGAQTTTGGYTTSPLFNMGLRLMSTPSNGLQGLAAGLQDASQSMQQNDVARQDLQKKTLDDTLFKQVFSAEVPTQDAIKNYMQQGGKVENAMKVLNMASGMQLPTGNVMNPFTGEQTYRDPNGTVDYQANKAATMAQVGTDAAVNQYKALSPLQLEDKLKESKGLSDIQWEDYKRQNEVQFKQDMEKLKAQLSGQEASAARISDRQEASSERALDKQATQNQMQDARSELKRIRPIMEGVQTQLQNIPQVDGAFSKLASIDPSNLRKTVSEGVAGVLGTDVQESLSLARQALNDQILGSLPPGAASDADVKMAVTNALDSNQSIEGMLANWNRLKEQLKYRNAYYADQLDQFNNILYQPAPTQGRSDSGASMSNSGGGWGVQ